MLVFRSNTHVSRVAICSRMPREEQQRGELAHQQEGVGLYADGMGWRVSMVVGTCG
jgi:hypothetical protein